MQSDAMPPHGDFLLERRMWASNPDLHTFEEIKTFRALLVFDCDDLADNVWAFLVLPWKDGETLFAVVQSWYGFSTIFLRNLHPYVPREMLKRERSVSAQVASPSGVRDVPILVAAKRLVGNRLRASLDVDGPPAAFERRDTLQDV